jgi:hypothetical protein
MEQFVGEITVFIFIVIMFLLVIAPYIRVFIPDVLDEDEVKNKQ